MSETFTIPANGRIPVGFPARYIFVESVSVADAEFDIIGYGEHLGDEFEFSETMTEGASLSGFPVPVADWYLINKNDYALTVEVKAGLVYYNKNALVGDVNALTTYKNLTDEGNQFIAGGFRIGLPDNYSHYAFKNQGGKPVYVTKIWVNGFGGAVDICRNTSGITDMTIQPIWGAPKDTGGTINTGYVYDSASSSMQTFADGLQTREGDLVFSVPSGSDGKPSYFGFGNSPIKVQPGHMIIARAQVGKTISCSMEFSE